MNTYIRRVHTAGSNPWYRSHFAQQPYEFRPQLLKDCSPGLETESLVTLFTPCLGRSPAHEQPAVSASLVALSSTLDPPDESCICIGSSVASPCPCRLCMYPFEGPKRRPEKVNGSRFKISRTEAICLIPRTHPNPRVLGKVWSSYWELHQHTTVLGINENKRGSKHEKTVRNRHGI